MSTAGQPEFAYTTRIENGKTTIEITGKHDVAFVINSESGERIYFPPEDMSTEADDRDSPYQSEDSPYQSHDSPYQADSPYQPADSPYEPADEVEESTRGVSETRSGFRITHPEPAASITVFRRPEAA